MLGWSHKSIKKQKYQEAADLLYTCHKIYQEGDFPLFDSGIREMGEGAYNKYLWEVKKHLNKDKNSQKTLNTNSQIFLGKQ